jgi:hypothetical protein
MLSDFLPHKLNLKKIFQQQKYFKKLTELEHLFRSQTGSDPDVLENLIKTKIAQIRNNAKQTKNPILVSIFNAIGYVIVFKVRKKLLNIACLQCFLFLALHKGFCSLSEQLNIRAFYVVKTRTFMVDEARKN